MWNVGFSVGKCGCLKETLCFLGPGTEHMEHPMPL